MAFVNGTPLATYYNENRNYLNIELHEDFRTVIDKVDITLAKPSHATDAAQAITGVTVSETANYTLEQVSILDPSGNAAQGLLTESDYRYQITLKAKDGYCMNADAVEVYINGVKAENFSVANYGFDLQVSADYNLCDYTATVTPPTCTAGGYTTYACSCGTGYMGDFVAATGHNPGAAATCTSAQICTVCSVTLADPLGHSYADGVCANCGRHLCAVDATYIFNASDLTAAEDKEAIPEGSYVGTNNYFRVEGKVQKRRFTSSQAKAIELGKNETGMLTFEVGSIANITIYASSTGSINDSVLAIIDSEGNRITGAMGDVAVVTGTSPTAVTYNDLPAGKYSIVSPTGTAVSRTTRVISVHVVESGLNVAHNFENGFCTVCGEVDPNYIAPEAPKPSLQKGEDGNYYYYVDGEIATDFTGLVANSAGNWYILNGQAQLSYDGLVTFEGTKYLIKAGHVNTAFTGITKQEGVYYYFNQGVNDLEFDGLVYCNGMKAYVQDGEVNFNKTGVVEDEGKLVYVKYGIWRNTFKGLGRTDDGQWIYMANGTFDQSYTGVAKLNSNWVYVNAGYVDASFSGTITVNGVDYTVKYGVVQF